jgi:ABC-type nitrate/sulfonate/bicarbonate transport system ATPase subunit
MARLRLSGVSRAFRGEGREIRAVDGVDLELGEGEIATIVGRSGAGKTTLLRIAAGLERPDSGRATRAEGTRVGFVFQEPRLLSSLNVEGNVALGLGSKRAEREGRGRVLEVLDQLGIEEYRGLYPAQLSGGIAQRAALGRALVRDPELLLMDEPFSALDAPLRARLQEDLLGILASRRASVAFVTHDLGEALYLGDRVLVLRAGRIVRDERVALERPRDRRSGEFLARMDFLSLALGGHPMELEEDSA